LSQLKELKIRSEYLINLVDRSGIRPRSPNKMHRTEMMQCHAFRKYFQTTAKLAGMDSLLIDRCKGHTTGLHDSYSKLDGDQTLEGNDKMIGYIGAIDDLTIDETNILRRKVKTLEVEKDRMDESEATVRSVKEQLGIK